MTNIRKHDIYVNLVDGDKGGSCPQAPVPIMEEYSEHYITLSYIGSIITSFRQFIFGTLGE
jgi:hypothetical protein